MPEDATPLIGFNFFDNTGQNSIANEAAVEQASRLLFNQTAFDAAADKLGRATDAVQAAARRKNLEDTLDPDDQVTFDVTEGFDFFL